VTVSREGRRWGGEMKCRRHNGLSRAAGGTWCGGGGNRERRHWHTVGWGRKGFTGRMGQLRLSGLVAAGLGKMKNGLEAGLGCKRKQAKIKKDVG
jgi:hypothetical protein